MYLCINIIRAFFDKKKKKNTIFVERGKLIIQQYIVRYTYVRITITIPTLIERNKYRMKKK